MEQVPHYQYSGWKVDPDAQRYRHRRTKKELINVGCQ